MVLNANERLVAEAVKNILDDTVLGSKSHEDNEERAHTFTFLHEEVEQAYRLEVFNLNHFDDIASAFSKIHSHKYLDDPKFPLALQKELSARGVPLDETDKALKAIETLKNKLLKKQGEKDAGFNPDLDEIIDISQPQQIEESIEYNEERQFFTDPKVRKFLKTDKIFIESINRRIKPYLEQLGYDCGTINEFWEAYDDDSTEFVVRNMLHELFETAKARYRSYL